MQLEKEKCPPGKYYPFVSGKIKVFENLRVYVGE
jgi:hypothetical protein